MTKEYIDEILKTALGIIQAEDSVILSRILIEYDKYKKKELGIENDSVPHWVLEEENEL